MISELSTEDMARFVLVVGMRMEEKIHLVVSYPLLPKYERKMSASGSISKGGY